jgi:hypothetical protein
MELNSLILGLFLSIAAFALKSGEGLAVVFLLATACLKKVSTRTAALPKTRGCWKVLRSIFSVI